MRINSYDSTSFGVNLNSPKLRYDKKDFFVNINGYGKNWLWAYRTKKTADKAVDLVRKDSEPESVLKFITNGIAKANKFCMERNKRSKTGLLRAERDGWESPEWPWGDLITYFGAGRYSLYKARLHETGMNQPITRPNNKIGISRPTYTHEIIHGNSGCINDSLDYVFELSKKIFPKFIHKEVQSEDMKEVNDTIAEIRWVLAHSTPWVRGSDAISNVFMRVMYKAIGIKTYPLAEGVSLDLEAYCTELEDYKKEFPYYFEKPPEIIE